jgi:hypothetical protein
MPRRAISAAFSESVTSAQSGEDREWLEACSRSLAATTKSQAFSATTPQTICIAIVGRDLEVSSAFRSYKASGAELMIALADCLKKQETLRVNIHAPFRQMKRAMLAYGAGAVV